jgi:hypothetical protein
MAKRQSMRGMGADALFSPPPATPTDASTPASQHSGLPASQHTSEPAQELVKATFYLTPELIMKLEQVRLVRKRKGEKVDKSALVREAIAQLAEE